MIKDLREKFLHGNLGLVIATWILVFIGIASTWFVKCSMDAQVTEMKKATQLQWRPFLHIDHFDAKVGFNYTLGETIGTDTVFKELDSVSLSSTEYMAVRGIAAVISSKIKFTNSGATPLNITYVARTTISKFDWFITFDKSPERLIDSLLLLEYSNQDVVDRVVLPDSSISSSRDDVLPMIMDKQLFLRDVKSDSLVVLYNCTFVEYEDFFKNIYNAFLMEFLQVPLFIENDKVRYLTTGSRPGLEIYRWDLAMNKQLLPLP